MASQESDPFDRAVAREAELRERESRRESPRALANRATLASFLALTVLFPVTWWFGRDVGWLVFVHVFLMAASVATGIVISILPKSAFEEQAKTPPRGADVDSTAGSKTGVAIQHRNRMAMSMQGFLFFAGLLPITLLFGRHLTWLVVTHFVIVVISLSQVVTDWFRERDRKDT